MYNRELQVIDTPEKAYLLGLFYSDGCITNCHNSYSAKIVLHEKDKNLLELLIKYFPFLKLRRHTKISYCVTCNKKSFVEDLIANGMIFRKSFNGKELLRFPELPKELQNHFIRGYFDGDGSVYKQKLGNTKFEIGGPCFRMITDIVKVLYDNKITVNLTCKYTGTALRKQDCYILYCSSDKVSKQFANYIYADCGELFMKRKYDRLYFIPEYSHREKLVCPRCGNNNTTRGGTRLTKERLAVRGYCKDCDKQFTITAPLSSNIQSGGDELLEG